MTALRVCFVGDSITNGTNDTAFLGWPGRLCAREVARGHDLTCYNLGIRADTAALIAARWRAECAARLPDTYNGALVFAFGANDSAIQEGQGPRATVAGSVATARAMLTEALAWKPVLWVGPAPVDDTRQPLTPSPTVSYDFRNARVAAVSAAYAVLAGELGVPYLDLYTPLSVDSRWPGFFAGDDGVHPSGDGYTLIADRVETWPAWRAWLD
ncbi:MAG: lipase [Hyphomicrobiales bacterium]|nr:lipase [Hyphomicrobiales bacterium]MCP5371059.1 lipase [Hyphomicrobiales bacterium]